LASETYYQNSGKFIPGNRRPKGRIAGAPHCCNPRPSPNEIDRAIGKALTKNNPNRKKAWTCSSMDTAKLGLKNLIFNHHTRASFSRIGISHRHDLGVAADYACWRVLFSTVNMMPVKDARHLRLKRHREVQWFECTALNEARLHQLALFATEATSRTSRFLQRWRNTDYLAVRYGRVENKEEIDHIKKYCKIYISSEAFFAAGVTPEQLLEDVQRREKYALKRSKIKGTWEHEKAKQLGQHLKRIQYQEKKERQERKERSEKARKKQENKDQERIQANEILSEYAAHYGHLLNHDQVLQKCIEEQPHFAHIFKELLNRRSRN
jgi:hypothetical protein